MLVIIDNGHGKETRGKCSPDGLHREWQWSREMARRIAGMLGGYGIESRLFVPEERDIPLAERCRRANKIAGERADAILISIHNNASGDGSRWLSASGWSAFVSHNASQNSRRLASLLTAEALDANLGGNRATPPCGYWSANLAICRDTRCPAVLTENMFQDCKSDVELISSEEGKNLIAAIHVNALLKYFNIKK
ncbi:MAG: N-acetylmuramoyl-L-alanine amidase [Bacteroidales bacterium]|nr:N-acetylmuramoyl-L-alanine amidase [Bacteroidales bacterium]